jgi:hypothetical protein
VSLNKPCRAPFKGFQGRFEEEHFKIDTGLVKKLSRVAFGVDELCD